MTEQAFTRGLIAELGKKTAVSWVRSGQGFLPVWHVWYDDALYLVTGGDEQPLPGIEDATSVEVVMRSKDNGGRLVTWVGEVSRIRPGDALWEPATTALIAGRLNVPDLATAAAGWAEHSVVSRILPTGEVVEAPGDLDDDAHLHEPLPTGATTRGALPKVLHRRVTRRPRLS